MLTFQHMTYVPCPGLISYLGSASDALACKCTHHYPDLPDSAENRGFSVPGVTGESSASGSSLVITDIVKEQ